MRIIQITPGSGGSFYCENCLRDVALVKALRGLGHDAVTVPMYLPILIDEAGFHSAGEVFFGGINVYLQQKFALFRRSPRWVDRLFDAPALLKWSAQRSSMTSSRDLCEITLSMLRGAAGFQVKEIQRLVAWLVHESHPDVICLSNALLGGLTPSFKAALKTPVVCVLQDEDTWVDAMPEPYRGQVWDLLAQRAAEMDALVAVSHAYAGVMSSRLAIPLSRIRVVHPGIPLEGYAPSPRGAPPVIGYLGRMAPDLGLQTLVDAFLLLKQKPAMAAVRLSIAGGQTADDTGFVAAIRDRLARAGALADTVFQPNLGQSERQAFLQTLAVMSVPMRNGAAFGQFILESLAAGVPVVQPRVGAFPELIEATGGGVIFEPNTAPALAAALESLLLDPARRQTLGQRGRAAVYAKFSAERMAREMAEIFAAAGGQRPPEAGTKPAAR